MNRRLIVASLFAVALPVAAFAATSSESKTYKDVKSDAVFDAARESITANGWKIKDESKSDGLLVARTKISAMSWGATVTVNVNEVKTGVKVTATAGTEMSSGGKVDKDVERFFEKLDKKLAK